MIQEDKDFLPLVNEWIMAPTVYMIDGPYTTPKETIISIKQEVDKYKKYYELNKEEGLEPYIQKLLTLAIMHFCAEDEKQYPLEILNKALEVLKNHEKKDTEKWNLLYSNVMKNISIDL